ncbi:MAG: amino acid permease [Thaumarchaeota archaeon]|nr:amino acid permease [Nitrososphaerota archaeon]
MSQGGNFLRSATGLVREFTAADAALLAVGSIAPGFAWIFVFTSEWFVFPGVNLPVSAALIGILALLQGVFYVLMTSAMPRSGGTTYVALSRLVNPALGLAMPFIFFAYMVFTTALTATAVIGVGLNSQLATFAAVTNNSGLASIASSLSSTSVEFVTAGLLVIITGLIVISGSRWIKIVNWISFIAILTVLFAMLYIMGTTSQAQFTADVNKFAGSGAYQAVISKAHSSGWSVPSDWLVPTLLSLPLSWFNLNGYQWNTYYSGEIRRITRSMSFAVLFSITFATAYYVIMSLFMQTSFGIDFINSAGYLYNTGTASALSIAPYPNDLVLIINSNPILNYLMIASFILAGYSFIANTYLIASRSLLAWSFDRVIPSAFGAVNEKLHGPVRAMLVVMLFFLLSTSVYVFFPTYQADVGAAFLAITAILLDGLTGIFLPIRKAIFDKAPEIVRKKVAGIPVVSILGAYSLVFTAYLFYALVTTPAIGGPLGNDTELTIVVAFVLGLLTYFTMKAYHKRHGLDITLAFKELPPE